MRNISTFNFRKSAASLEPIYNIGTFELLHLPCEMDQKVEIKEEPVWLEGTASTSLEDFELVSEMIPLKQETKSELTEPVPTHGNAFESATDIKDEIIIEERTIDGLVPHFKEENSAENVAVLTMDTEDGLQHSTVCSRMISQELNLKENISSYSDEGSYVFDICNRQYRQKATLNDNKLILSGGKSPALERRVHRCPKCSKTFTLACNLRNHTFLHTGERPYHCHQCRKTFARRSYLQSHMVIHTGERSYYCENCNNTFARRTDLIKHMIVHSGERPYRCTQCYSTFARSTQLKHHACDYAGGMYCCKQCNAKFPQRIDLHSHMVKHAGEKPFHCDICNGAFASRRTLTQHTKIHSGERPYSCGQCSNTFKRRSYLVAHMAIHIREKPYHCNLCNSKFARRSNLQRHGKIHSGESL